MYTLTNEYLHTSPLHRLYDMVCFVSAMVKVPFWHVYCVKLHSLREETFYNWNQNIIFLIHFHLQLHLSPWFFKALERGEKKESPSFLIFRLFWFWLAESFGPLPKIFRPIINTSQHHPFLNLNFILWFWFIFLTLYVNRVGGTANLVKSCEIWDHVFHTCVSFQASH